jgi:predicted nucleotidyltransferase
MTSERGGIAAQQHALSELRRILRCEMPYLRERYKVRSLGVFGSYVRGEQRSGSDLDVLADFYIDQRIAVLRVPPFAPFVPFALS